jgi:hypothetical protein
VLNPAGPLFREARYLLADEPDLRDVGLYHSVLTAIAEGSNTRPGSTPTRCSSGRLSFTRALLLYGSVKR